MFGLLRTLLAATVVYDHDGGAHFSAAGSVFGFFVLSGFLMTLLMNGDYAGRPGTFLLNRFLRLYPLYWATAAWMLIAGFEAWQPSISGLRQLFFIVFWDDPHKLVPTAWAVTNEMLFYLLIAAGLSRTLLRTTIWLCVSILHLAYVYAFGRTDMIALYMQPWAAALPFAVGAMTFHLRNAIPAVSKALAFLALIIAFGVAAGAACIASFVYFDWHQPGTTMFIFNLNLLPSAVVVLCLYRLRDKRFHRFDKMIGRFSYPIYLGQGLAWAIECNGIAGYRFTPGFGLERTASVLLTCIALSMIALPLIDAPVQFLRRRLRNRQQRQLSTLQAPGEKQIGVAGKAGVNFEAA